MSRFRNNFERKIVVVLLYYVIYCCLLESGYINGILNQKLVCDEPTMPTIFVSYY